MFDKLKDQKFIEDALPFATIGNIPFVFAGILPTNFAIIILPLFIICFTTQVYIEVLWWRFNSLAELLADGDPGENGAGLFIFHLLDAVEVISVVFLALRFLQLL